MSDLPLIPDADALTELLTALHARGAFALRVVMTPPFSMRILAEAPITVLAPVRGRLCVVPDDGDTHWIGPGDVAVTRGPDHYSVADDPSTDTTVVIHPGQECRTPDGRSALEDMTHGVRTWGNDPNGETLVLVGAYDTEAEVSRRLMRCLPPVFSLRTGDWDASMTTVLCEEMARDVPGQMALLDRLIDLVLTAALKAWVATAPGREPSIASQNDPMVGEALRILREDPARAWSLVDLATEIGVSRSVLSRRFHQVVGEPPMAFLTNWRMSLAADWMCEPDATVSAVAERLGYSTPFAFSTAFKRVHGVSPTMHREQTAATLQHPD